MSVNNELWAVSTKGNVYTLSPKAHTWQRINNEGQCLRGFKKVASTPQGAWGLGCDQLVYVYVVEADVPIRVQVATYENERWMLSRGWGGDNLLPHVDPWHWSNEDGSVHLPKPDFKLPQFWHWESEWMVDENVKGYLTDKGGWRYSNINFQSEFSHRKTFKSCVRRRRWIRYRRYHALNRWARLPSIHVDPLEEPIMDLTAGGHLMPNQSAGYVAVWIATINGRVLTRIGVTAQCPDGQSWKDIAVTDEVLNISVGPMGLLWAVTWAGGLLVRTGVSWHNPLGSGWKEVDPPADLEGKDHLVQCVVGINAVWVTSQEGKVWLRRGVSSGSGDISESGACGSGWLHMVQCSMKTLAIGQHDKVLGIDSDDFHIYFRSGISQQESSGKSWKIMDLPYENLARQSSCSLSSFNTAPSPDSPENTEHERISTESMNETMTESMAESMTESVAESVKTLQDVESSGETGSMDDISENLTRAQSEPASISGLSGAENAKSDAEKSPKKGFRSWSSRLKSQANAKFYVPLTESKTFKRNEKAINNVLGYVEKNITHRIEDGIDMGKKVGKGLERKLEQNIPAIKQVTRRNDPDVTLQYSKDEAPEQPEGEGEGEGEDDRGTKTPVGRVSIQMNDTHGSQESLSSSRDRNSTSRESVSKNSKLEKDQPWSRSENAEQADSELRTLNRNQSGSDKRKGVHFNDLKTNALVDPKCAPQEGVSQEQALGSNESCHQASVYSETSEQASGINESSQQASGGHESSPDPASEDSTFDSAPFDSAPFDSAPFDSASLPDSDGLSLTSVEIRELADDGTWMKYETDPDEGEIQWVWISASALDIPDENVIRQWFIKEEQVSGLASRYRVSQAGWRNLILRELRCRNETQGEAFPDYKLAVQKGVWCKKGSLRWWQDLHRGQKWVDCTVELTQDSDGPKRYAAFTLHYQVRGDFKFLQVELSEMTAVFMMTDKTAPAAFGIHTTRRLEDSPRQPPLRFSAQTEDEAENWVGALSVGCCEQRCMGNGVRAQAALWSVSARGEIFVHEPQEADTELPQQMFWHQLGGHLKLVETSGAGITWGIGHSGTAYVYSGGYGGGFFKGMATSPHGIYSMTDQHEHYVYENQRWRLLRGYTNRMLLVDHYMWSDETGKKEVTKDGTKLPSVHWQWAGEWTVDRRLPGDKEGWQYARSIAGPFSAQPRFRSNFRRRRWFRRSRVTTTGPWSEVGPLPLRAVTVQMEDGHSDSASDSVAVWAVGKNGDVLCRVGVTRDQPRGTAWQHVTTDLGFTSISMSLDHSVWGVASDGSAWLRNGITTANPTGSNWSQVPPPDNSTLVQIAAGCQFVMAVDDNNVLWLRQGICTSVMEGSSWEQVAKNVQQVSIGPRDQVWVILDGVSSKAGTLNGVVSRRVGISHDKPKAGAWDHGIGGDWSYISARGWIK